MGNEQDEHDQRLARIKEQLDRLSTLTADTREEVLVATEQLIDRALAAHREAVADSRRARAERGRVDKISTKRRIRRG